MNNRLHNSKNPYQTDAKRVLCLCSAGLLRSPTMANVIHKQFGYNTRAAGVDANFALIPVDEVLLSWADEIVCASEGVAYDLVMKFPDYGLNNPKVKHLNLPDDYSWGDEELILCITQQYNG